MEALAVWETARKPYRETEDDAPPGSGPVGAGSAGEGGEDTELEELGDEIARMAAHLHAYRQRYLERVAQFDRRRGWEPGGHRSCAHWLSYRAGVDLNTAREHVRVARALEELPRTSRAMARGRLSFSQVRAPTRVASPEEEAELVELAEGVPTSTLERMVRAWKKGGTRREEADRERELHRLRRLSVFPDDDGGYVVRGRLTPEVGTLLTRALEAAGDALYRKEERTGSGEEASERQRRREAARRRRRSGQRQPRRAAPGLPARGPGDAGRGGRARPLRAGGRDETFS